LSEWFKEAVSKTVVVRSRRFESYRACKITTITMNANEVKKELYKSKANAKFSHYAEGKLFYTVELSDGTYMFPIDTVDKVSAPLFKIEIKSADTQTTENVSYTKAEGNFCTLSADLGSTPFGSEVKGSDLNRWIAKAIEKDDFIKISI
jgi:hypothetical protein